ncbi:Plasmodium exported protein (Pm-fam-a like), unknown function [Plasmodium malariae]|uniref:Fam-m protein n=1 Tax=Plasmodium malariae TaxID=5858 RepID=A0A1A8X2I0_PLAMA|nr:Plasmodium exported protein (Pm-fam-a like), unknown function [Plasmodium malariae]
MYHFSNDLLTLKKPLSENYSVGRKLNTSNIPLLDKNKQYTDSVRMGLKQNVSYNTKHEKKDLYSSEVVKKRNNNHDNGNSLNKAQYYTEVIDYNNGMFDGKYFHFEKKWIKKKDYDSFLEKNRRIRSIELKKIKFRSYGLGVTIFVIFFLFGIGLPILHGTGILKIIGNKLDVGIFKEWSQGIKEFLKQINLTEIQLYVILYFLLLLILAIIIIIAITKIFINNEKYKKLTLTSE